MKQRLFCLLLSIILLLAVAAPPAQAAPDLVDPYGLYTYSELCADISELAAAYPELIVPFSIGASADGRDLCAFRFGRGSQPVVLCAAMHGREYLSSAVLMYVVDHYCQGYRYNGVWNGISYRQVLDQVCFYVVPMLNPDGVSLAQSGLASVSAGRRAAVAAMPLAEEPERGYAAWKSNINGVDLNRNFPYKWGWKIKAEQPASWEYIGAAPLSEPESQAMQALLDSVDYAALVSLHTMGEIIYWLDTDTLGYYDQFHPLAQRLADISGYALMPPEDTSQAGGFMVNSERVAKGRFCVTVELARSVYQPDVDDTLQKAYGMILLVGEAMGRQAPAQITVMVNGVPVSFPDQQPLIRDGRTLVPIRPVLEACGCTVDWDPQTQVITVSRDSQQVQLIIDVPTLLTQSGDIPLDVAPCIQNDRTLLPLRAVCEAFGYQVAWQESSRTISVER